jgi:ABC-type nickel/cobalt efflux system permease component RcnA
MESQETVTSSSAGKVSNLWWLGGLGGLVALKFYYVREMIAALVIFSALFAIGAAIVLVIFTLDYITQRTFAWAESGARRLRRWAANSSGATVGHIGLSSQRLRFSTVWSNRLSRRS